jgi:hypothetical protein
MTTTYTFEQLKEDVQKEAEALRVHATKEERERLDIEMLDPSMNALCIYGLMTTHCNSDRAIHLIENCACRFIKTNSISAIERYGFKEIQEVINGAKADNLQKSRINLCDPGHYSAIEAYICLPEANNANLIAYLRCETETLEL